MSILQLPDPTLCVRLAATIGHFLWQGAAIYLLTILAAVLLRRSSAGARYVVFSAALLVMAVCPPVTFVLLTPPQVPSLFIGGQSPPHMSPEVTVAQPETPPLSIGGGQSPPYVSEADLPPVEPVSLAVPPEPAVEKIDWWRYAPWLVACYLGGTALMLARLLMALCGGHRLRRRSEPMDDSAILAAFARQVRALGLRFSPAIAFCRDVAVPTVVGVLRPMILLPLSAASGLTTEQIEVLLAHELAHIRRYDHLVNILQRLIEAVLFFHPAVWFISRRIRIEREHCCDDLVLAVGGGRFVYAQSLLRMAELSRGGQSPPYGAVAAALGAADRPSLLRLRILRLISGGAGEQVRLLRPAVLGLCLFLMLAAIACVRFASSRTDDRASDAVPPGMVGTWLFENPMGDDEQMAVFADGRVVVLYSNGHRDETQYVSGTIELAEYSNVKAKLLLLPDGRTLQTGEEAQGIAKIWQRIDPVPKTELLRPLTGPPAETATTQPASEATWPVYDLTGTIMAPPPEIPQEIFDMLAAGKEWEECVEILCRRPPQPAANVVVKLKGGSRTLETVSNSKGEYRFSLLPPGVYEVHSEMPGSRSGRMAVATAQVELVHYKNNIVDLSLSTDTITVRGRITDSRGNPVVGATVTAVEVQKGWVQYSEEWNPIKYSAKTGTDGSYELRELSPTVSYKIPVYLVVPVWGLLDNIDIRVEAPGLVQSKEKAPRVALVTQEQFDQARRVVEAAKWTISPENENLYFPPIKGNIITVNDIVLDAQSAAQPALRDSSPVGQLVKISMGQADVPQGGSRAWYLLRQLNCGPLLRELPLQFAKASDPAVESSVTREDVDSGVPLEIDVRREDDVAGEILVGLFTDEKWSQVPVRVQKVVGAGRHTIAGVPPGKYQVGAMIGDLLKPTALGVHKSWPQPVEVVAGRSNAVEILVSPQFERSLGQSYREIAEACQAGRKVESPDSLVQGRVTDLSGRPVAHAILQFRERTFGPRPRSIWAIDTGTDDLGRYFLDRIGGPFTISVVAEEPLPGLLGSRSQFMRAPGILRGKAEINLDLKPFPRGSASLSGRGVDQDGKPVQGFVVGLRQDAEIDEEEQPQRTFSYRVPCWTSDGRFTLTDLPPGKHQIMCGPFDGQTYQSSAFGKGVEVELKEGQTSDVTVLIKRKVVLYGRVLMEDGSVPPAAVKPPWPEGLMRLSSPVLPTNVGHVEPDGYAVARLNDFEYESLKSDKATLTIYYPAGDNTKRRGWSRVGVFSFNDLSPDREKAGVVKLRYADLPEPKPAASQDAEASPPATRPADASRIVLDGLWAKGRVVDGAGKKYGIEGPVYVFDSADPKLRTSKPMRARCSMLDISKIEFISRDDYPRVDVAFQFRDGKTAGGALFEMTLLDRNKEVLGTQRVLELRNREMAKEYLGSAVVGGDDPPNRSGKAEFYFRDVSLTDIDSFRLAVSEPGVAGLIQLLDETDAYPRESAARALGQIGSAAQPGVPRLTQFLDDPQPYLRDTARQALQRIAEGRAGAVKPPATRPATLPASGLRVVYKPVRSVTMPAVASRDMKPLSSASQPATQSVGDKLTLRVIPLHNAHAAEMGQTVRKVLNTASSGHRVALEDGMRGNGLLISAAEEELDRIAYLVAQLDKPPLAHAEEPAESMDRVAKVVRPKHAKATDVAETIASLYPPSLSTSMRDVVTAQADKERGSVAINCDPSMEKEINALVAQLDTAKPADDFIKVFHFPHSDLVALLDDVQDWARTNGADSRFTIDHGISSLMMQGKRADIRVIAELLGKPDRLPEGSKQGPKQIPVSRPGMSTPIEPLHAARPVTDDIADVLVEDLTAGGSERMQYFLIGPRTNDRVSVGGYKLVIVLPGGDGGADFKPFVCRIFKNALPAGYIVAQPVAFKWTPDQQIVWPTRMDKLPGQQFATEDFVEAVIKDVRSKYRLDDRHIFTLSWSSSGPAAYAISLDERSPVTGSFIAMSVFKPDQLPPLDRAKGRAYYLYHSPVDRVCPYWMAQKAESMLKEKAAAVALKTYQGGHGWQGGARYGAIRNGIRWLEEKTVRQ